MSPTELALVEWVNSLPFHLAISPISTVADLSDGVSLSKILVDVDASYFQADAIEPPAPGEEKPSFIAAVRSLKRLFKSISSYYTDVLGLPALDNSNTPNLSLIAKDGSVEENIKLAQTVLLIAVKTEGAKGSEYLDGLRHISNPELRGILLDLAGVRALAEPTVEVPDMETKIQAEVSKVIEHYEPIERAYRELKEENTVLHGELEKVKQQNLELQQQIQKTDGLLKAQVEVVEEKTRSQLEFLQKDIQDLEDQAAEREKKVADSDAQIKELQATIANMHSELDNTLALKDRLDESKFEIDRLKKLTNQIEKYKRQAEEAEEYQKQLTLARNEITYLVEKSRLLDEDTQQVFGLRRQVEVLESERNFYNRKSLEAEDAAEAARQELAQMRDKVFILEKDHLRDLELITSLEQSVRELEADAVQNKSRTIKDAEDQDMALTIEDLKAEIEHLKEEIISARMNSTSPGTSVDDSRPTEILKSELRETQNSKDRLQDNYLQIYQEKLLLQSQVDAIEDGSLGEGSDVLIQLRSSLQKNEAELADARSQIAQLERKLAEKEEKLQLVQSDLDDDKKDAVENLRRSVSKRLTALQAEYAVLLEQKEKVETDNKTQAELINKALIEKESLFQKLTASHEELLEVSRANTALRMSLVSLDPNAGGYDSELKSWVIDLQKRVETQRDKLKKAQEYIRQLKAEHEAQRRSAAAENASRKMTISVEEATNIKRELALMTSAWYSLTARIEQNKVVVVKKVQDSPESWLNRQRKIIEDKH